MTVEQLLRLLSEYPPHWAVSVEIPIADDLAVVGETSNVGPAVEVSACQSWDRPTPVVVISA